MLICSYIYMRKFWYNNTTIQEDNGESESYSLKLKQSLAELDCEETIINDKLRFGRVRKSVMEVLRAKYSDEMANRVLSRVNTRTQKISFKK